MSNTRIPSPARSLGGHRTPRRYIKRGTRSVGSPAPSNTSGRLTSIINMNIQPSALSPLPNRRSVLTDSTYIQEPRRKSWWRDIDDNSRDVLEVLESVTAGNTENATEELIEMEVLSQEKHDPIDLPESSDSESINSIVLTQRKLFTQNELQPKNKFVQLIGNRESLAKLNKNSYGHDKTVIASTKALLQNRKQRTKPVFPAALLSASPNKTTDDVFKETNTEPPKNQVRNIFNVKPPAKRKNMFAEFIITESDNEITEIEPKIFEFKKNTDITQQLQKQLITSTDIEMDDWTHLPSSTMVDKQIEDEIAITPQKKCRLSKLSEAKESEVGANSNTTVNKTTRSNKSLKNLPTNFLKESSLNNNQTVTREDNLIIFDKNTSNPITLIQSFKEIRKSASTSQIQSQHISVRDISKDKLGEAYKRNDQIVQQTTPELLNNTSNDINMEDQNVQQVIVNTENQSKDLELQDEADDHNFTLEYDEDDDDEHLSVVSKELNEINNISITRKATSSQLETEKFKNLEKNEEVLNELLELDGDSNNIDNVEQSKQESVNNEQAQMQGEQNKENRNISNCNLLNSNEAQNNTVQKENGQDCINNEKSKSQTKQSEGNQNISDYNLVDSEEAKNDNAQEDNEVQKTPFDEADKNHEAEENESSDNIENSLQEQNKSNEIEVDEYAQDDDDVAEEPEENEYDVQEYEEDISENSDNENQVSDDDQEVEQVSENDNEIEESEDVIENIETSNDNESQCSNEDPEVESVSENDNEKEESEDVIDNIETSNDNGNQCNNEVQGVESVSENDNEKEESEDMIDNVRTSNNDVNSPEAILHDRTNQIDSLIEGHTSTRKTKSTMLKSLHIRRSMATVQEVTGFSDEAKSSSAENSFWDSHRTTRKTIRKTLGRDDSPRKSLRTLVMERSAKRQTTPMDTHWDTAKFPQANSTEFPETSNQDVDVEEPAEQSVHEISKRTRQATLEMCFRKIKQKSLEQRLRIEEDVKKSLKTIPADNNLFKVPKKPTVWNNGLKKSTQNKPRQKKSLIPLEDLPPEVLEDLKYKPPKRFKPSNASWVTPRLYKFLENKLEAKYDYKARVRAEQLVAAIYDFTKNIKRLEIAPTAPVQVLKYEMARLNIIRTHFEFYNFFHKFMPRDIRIKVIPDVVNKISLPKHGIYSNIING